MSTFSIYLAGFAMLAMGRCQPAPDKPPPGKAATPELERLIQDMVADDAKVATEARERLKKMGPEVVPVLFDRLVKSGWDLKPPLLEVLSEYGAGEPGLDLATKKLLHGTDTEKTHAALLYELIDESQHPDTPEFKAMVEVLLGALDSEDKYLRAAAGLALVHDEESTVFFQHLHRIVPAVISSFDTDLVIPRGREDASSCVFAGLSMILDSIIGDEMAYFDRQRTLWRDGSSRIYEPRPVARCAVADVLSSRRAEVDRLRGYWSDWWDAHKALVATEIGKLIVERNLRFLEADQAGQKSHVATERSMLAEWSLRRWTQGTQMPDGSIEEWKAWWAQNREMYKGPWHREE